MVAGRVSSGANSPLNPKFHGHTTSSIMATIVIPLQVPPRVNGVKRKRSANPSDSVTSHHPSFASALSSLNTSPNESDDEEFSESDGTFSDDSDASSERSHARSGTTKKVSAAPILVNGQLVSIQGAKSKKYKCNFPGCQKSYAKPTRLEEHLRSHTGEVCVWPANQSRSY